MCRTFKCPLLQMRMRGFDANWVEEIASELEICIKLLLNVSATYMLDI